MDPGYPIRFSVTPSRRVSSSLKETRLTAVGKSHVFKHAPVWTFHNLIVLSADPDASIVESLLTDTVHMAPTCPLYVPSRSPLCEYHTLTT